MNLTWDSSPARTRPRRKQNPITTPTSKFSSNPTTKTFNRSSASTTTKTTTTLLKSTRYTPKPQITIHHNQQIQSYGTQLRTAASEGQTTEILRLLNESKWKQLQIINTTDQWKYTALMEASMWGHVTAVALLLKQGADVTLTSTAGETALHWSAMNNHPKVVSLLLNDGKANPNLSTIKKKKTALHLATEKGHAAVVELLIQAGCNMSLLDVNGDTAYDIFVRNEPTKQDDDDDVHPSNPSDLAIVFNKSASSSNKRVQLKYVESRMECEDLKKYKDKLLRRMHAQKKEIQALKKVVMEREENLSELKSNQKLGSSKSWKGNSSKPRFFLSRVWGEEDGKKGQGDGGSGGSGGGGGGEENEPTVLEVSVKEQDSDFVDSSSFSPATRKGSPASGGSSTTRTSPRQSSFGRYDNVNSRETTEQTRAHYHNYVKDRGSLSSSGNGTRKSIKSPYTNGRIHSTRNTSSPANSKVIKKEWRSHF